MPKGASRKRAAAQEYGSDGGFVEDAPKSKKSKGANAKPSVDMEMKKDDDGNEYWDISGKRRVQISTFKGTTMVNIREFYEKDGKMLPGKKGISLSTDQYNTFVELLPQVNGVLREKGLEVSTPSFDQAAARPSKPAIKEEDDEEDDEEKVKAEEEDEDEAPGFKSAKSKLDKFKHKPNHEATSDEDEG